ncbi:glutamate receptor 1-like [Epargyreus clarus]|uniref:glutamate receptor 1-like n=1 Tax=Epargyreus clarus TaxID=520877 RepID=UPI003C307043
MPAAAAILRDIVVLCCELINNWYFKRPDYFEAIAKVVAALNSSNYECNPPGVLHVYDYGDRSSKMLKKVEFEGITGHIAFTSDGHRRNFTLQVVELNNNRTLKKIGFWYDYKGLDPIVPPKPKMLPGEYDRNRTYIVTTVEEPPYVMSNTEVPGMPIPFNYRGFCVELTEKLCDMMEIRCEMRLSADGLYGLENPAVEGGWDGAIGELLRDEADMAITSMLVTLEREMVIDYSRPFLTIDKKMKKAYNFFFDAFAFFAPFAKHIWYCIAIASIIVSSVLWLVSRFSPLEWRVLNVQEPERAVTPGDEEPIPDKYEYYAKKMQI